MCVATIDVEREECRKKEQLSLRGAPDPLIKLLVKEKEQKKKKKKTQQKAQAS